MWHAETILDTLADTLQTRERELRDEQAIHGLDALSEIELQALLAAGLSITHPSTLREQTYPKEWQQRAKTKRLPERRDRLRADIVLLPPGFKKIDDDVRNQKNAESLLRSSAGTLFECHAHAHADAILTSTPPQCCHPQDAFWLEIKVVGQFTHIGGVPGPNTSYASQLRRSLSSDVAKLASDPMIHTAAAALILFTAGEPTASHDLAQVFHSLLDKDLPILSPIRRSFTILDRIGNTTCTIALTPISPTAHAFPCED